MDKGLFAKHIRTLSDVDEKKKELIALILATTGVELKESELIVSKKDVSFLVSSVKKSILLQKGSKGVLEGAGFHLLP